MTTDNTHVSRFYCFFFQMCPREDVDYQGLKLQEMTSDLAEVKSDLTEMKSELVDVYKHLMSAKENVVRQEVKSDLADVREDLQLQDVKSELAEVKRSLKEMCDVLVKLADKGRDK